MNRPWVLWAMWLGILMSASGVMHWYFWRRFLKDTDIPAGWARWGGWIFSVFTFLIPCSFFLRRHLLEPVDSIMYLGLISWLAILFFLICLRCLAGLIPFGLSLHSVLWRKKPYDPARRKFLSRALAAGTLTVGGIGVLRGTLNAFEDPEINEVTVKLDRLPPRAHGLSIVQITDVHAAPWTSENFIRRLVERTNALKPDIIAITGDLVDADVAQIGQKVSVLGKLSARYGVFFVTGNHEYYVGTDEWLAMLEKLGMKILTNSGVALENSIYLAGIPDRTVRRVDPTGRRDFPDIARALASRPADLPVVLLAHQPRDIDLSSSAGVDLQLSGHTHGGQIWPFGALVMASQPYLSGLHRHGPTQIYVSRGAGTWGPPIRIGAPAELTKIVLV